jgi:PAS domain S-box-containing protein
VSLIFNQTGQPDYFVSVVEDITEKKRAESEHNKLFNVSFDLLCIAGFDGYFKELNPAWERVTGYTLQELLAESFLDFIHSDDRQKTIDEVENLKMGEKTSYFETRYLKKNGETINLAWTATPMLGEQVIYCIARDVTEQKMAEKKVFDYQQRLKELSNQLLFAEEKQRRQIAADLHDDVGQLLASSRLQMAAIDHNMPKAEILDKIKVISNGLREAIQTTRNVIFELNPPQLNEIGLAAALSEWMEKEVSQKYDLRFNLNSDNQKYNMDNATRHLVFRSVRELLINVIKHAKASQVNVHLEQKKKSLKISIRDNGCGFNYNPDVLRLKGSGFGLFSILERTESISGKVFIDSSPGKGTKVTLDIPLKKDSEK